jgi:thiamine-phosphate diphosphorylase
MNARPSVSGRPPRGVLCLVTSGGALSSPPTTLEGRVAALAALIDEAVSAGIDLVQIREPDLPARLLAEVVEAAVKASRGRPTRIVVNDRVDVALAAGADGAHLGARSLRAARVRPMTPPGFLLGRSIHTVEEARAVAAEQSADYLTAGTVFCSPSKPNETRLLGTDGLSAVVRAVTMPVLAIGGIDLDTIASVARTGASGFAAIRLFSDAVAGSRLREIVKRAREAFDTTKVIP